MLDMVKAGEESSKAVRGDGYKDTDSYQKNIEKYYMTDDIVKVLEKNQEREKADEFIRILDAVTAENRKLKKKYSPYIEASKFSMNPLGYLAEAKLKNLHYSRNDLNDSAPQTIPEAEAMGWVEEKLDYCHQVGVPKRNNVKYIPSDGGRGEQIFKVNGTANGIVDTSAENMATPNWVNPQENLIGHFGADVVPWVLWGNRWDDSTSMQERIVMPLVYQIYEKIFNSDGDNPDNPDNPDM